MNSEKVPSIEMREDNVPSVSQQDSELAEALRNYVPHTADEKKLVKKIDIFLMPILWLMYILNYIDRTNIGNAKIAGMNKDLGLTDDGYNWPKQAIRFLPGIMLLVWGILSVLMSTSNSYGALLAFRFVLGSVEAGFFPGVLQAFCHLLYSVRTSGAFGGILAGGITSNLHDAHGIAGWRWLFIVGGVATVGVAIVAFFILLDYPETSKRLSPAEPIADPRTYMFLVLFMLDVGSGTISYFIPTLTLSLGYNTVMAQYMTVPIYTVAAVCLNIVAWSSDRHVERRWHIVAPLAVGFACSIVCAAVQTAVVRYVMICFVAAGIWSALPLILSWTSNVITLPPEKRAIVLAMVNAFGNFSSVYGSRIWPGSDAPAYHMGFGVTAGFLGAGMVLAAVIPILCKMVDWKGTKAEKDLATGREAEN
ncbi:Vitamin H transporter, putative [Tolypocladium paradoxum]|uniref:Vitamin H transporter, putative n=1 Tax=Tolypocladium paradoxum TaxID=94208 RepID=A0A2S4L1T8_9HYPO|nr:Vitamin H transporter, putative [Tolypocladium paradoxum]